MKIIDKIMFKFGYKKYNKFLDPYKDLVYEVIKESAKSKRTITICEGIFEVELQAVSKFEI